MEAKIQKLKQKVKNLKQVEQLNLDLQQKMLNLKENERDKKVSKSLERLLARITPKCSEDEVTIFEYRLQLQLF